MSAADSTNYANQLDAGPPATIRDSARTGPSSTDQDPGRPHLPFICLRGQERADGGDFLSVGAAAQWMLALMTACSSVLPTRMSVSRAPG
jgi:hypothetical protein